ncbi:ribonuclease HI family protein [Candidatus Babeliales bacterium]|nr:ribonuclease HI family protein [Candidatus Babeliales bacterium]
MQKKKLSSNNPLEIFVDGAARGNPGPAGAGVYIKQNDQEIIKKGFYLGEKTNNQAEYLSLALAIFLVLQEISELDIKPKLIITSDSELLVRQITGLYKVKNPILKQIKDLIVLLLKNINFEINHVLRDKNKIADKLSNDGVDKKNKLPAGFVCLLKKHNINIL